MGEPCRLWRPAKDSVLRAHLPRKLRFLAEGRSTARERKERGRLARIHSGGQDARPPFPPHAFRFAGPLIPVY